ncbi:MAG: protein kinase [Polyangiaceae bacterium]|nr:protein kinase [Polyangiaceae bacterium]
MTLRLEPRVLVAKRYRLERRLGEGGMGIVWAARDDSSGRDVALKFLKATDPITRKRLVREARAACTIAHPGVVAVREIVEHDGGVPALVMDLLEGESVAELLLREGKLSVRQAAPIFLGAVTAVAAAHAAGIVHRDLKPDNIFITREDEIKVLDFGIAKEIAVDSATARTAGTQSGALLGTPTFMSPEQVFGEKDIDHRTDIWSLGIVFYEALTGVVPTTSDNLGQVLKIIVTGAIRPLSEVAPDLDGPITSIVDRMISVDRASRPTLAEVTAVLAAALGRPAPRIPEPRMPAPRAPDAEPRARGLPRNLPSSSARSAGGSARSGAVAKPTPAVAPGPPWSLLVAALAAAAAIGLGIHFYTRNVDLPAAPEASAAPVQPSATASAEPSAAVATEPRVAPVEPSAAAAVSASAPASVSASASAPVRVRPPRPGTSAPELEF